MKKQCFIMLLLWVATVTSDVVAQIQNKEWQYEFFDDWYAHGDSIIGRYDEYNSYFFRFLGDMPLTINGKDYLWVYQHPSLVEIGVGAEYQRGSDVDPRFRMYSIGIRFENGRVLTDYEDYKFYQSCHLVYDYYRFPLFSHGDPNYLPYNLTADSTELILYDYTMEVGDSYRHVDGYEDIVVVGKDTIELSDDPTTSRRRLTLSNGLVLIEGIGCINSNGMLLDYLNPEAKYASRYTYLSACYRNRDGYVYYDYEKDSGLHIVDQATLGIEGASARSLKLTGIYDLQGRRLKDIPTKGLYIRNGKKHVIVK